MAYTPKEKLQLALDRGIVVDDEDLWLLSAYAWYINQGYAITQIYIGWNNDIQQSIQIATRLHHCIVGQPVWEGEEIDHIDRNPLNNRRSNLRYCDHHIQTMNNRRVIETNNVYWHARDECYDVIITRRKIRHYVGRFATKEEAVAAREAYLNGMEDNHG